MRKDSVIIVSGLPRSGTSLMMQMLASVGIPVLTDATREANKDNPRGYYEDSRVAKGNPAEWLGDAEGRAVKVVSHQLYQLAGEEHLNFYVLFMVRDPLDIQASMKRMHDDVKGLDAVAYKKHLNDVWFWFSLHTNFQVMRVEYEELVVNAINECTRVASWLSREAGCTLLVGHVVAMINQVSMDLWRNRNGAQNAE